MPIGRFYLFPFLFPPSLSLSLLHAHSSLWFLLNYLLLSLCLCLLTFLCFLLFLRLSFSFFFSLSLSVLCCALCRAFCQPCDMQNKLRCQQRYKVKFLLVTLQFMRVLPFVVLLLVVVGIPRFVVVVVSEFIWWLRLKRFLIAFFFKQLIIFYCNCLPLTLSFFFTHASVLISFSIKLNYKWSTREIPCKRVETKWVYSVFQQNNKNIKLNKRKLSIIMIYAN